MADQKRRFLREAAFLFVRTILAPLFLPVRIPRQVLLPSSHRQTSAFFQPRLAERIAFSH